ncbi:MAG TPA: hypothetical protein VFQ27_03050 [Xanthobacteraceae bacterium]|nr:hypothetical protein [Xanthobacteraceae bacterium]
MTVSAFEPGGYRYIPALFQYSSGVAALPGFEIVRVRFRNPPPLAQGFFEAERLMQAAGRAPTAFCACELRSPAPLTDQGFRAFNESYVVKLKEWGLFDGRRNPVARSNVCPAVDPPAEPVLYAFSFTLPKENALPTFVIAGSGEAREGPGRYAERTIRYGDTSPEAMAEKAAFVHDVMELRLSLIGMGWQDATATQVYTVHDLHPFFGEDIVRRGAARAGLTWHFCRPPVAGLEYEMDCRAVATERVV